MSLLYDIVKIPVYLTHAVYFRKVHLLNVHHVPTDKPVMLLPNHPNAFLDAVVVSIQLQQQVNFLVRSDVFNTPVKRWLLSKLNNFPIYRIQEGTENLKKNEETFRLCSELFRQNKTILIFPEGICIREKRLRKLKKGAARIAFGAEEQSGFDLDLKLVPVGVNYSKFGARGGDLILNFGEPVSIRNYKDQYTIEKARAINELTQAIEASMSRLVIAVPSEAHDKLFDQLETISFKAGESGAEKFERKKHITKKLVDISQNDAKFNELQSLTREYFNELQKAGTDEYAISKRTTWNIFKELRLYLLFPVFFVGAALNYLPYQWSYRLSTKVVRKEEFFDSVNMIGGMFIFLIFYLLLMIPFSLIIDNGYYRTLLFFLIPLSGCIALWWSGEKKRRRSVRKMNSLSPGVLNDIVALRERILTLIK